MGCRAGCLYGRESLRRDHQLVFDRKVSNLPIGGSFYWQRLLAENLNHSTSDVR